MKRASFIALSCLFLSFSYKSYQPNKSLDTHMSDQDTHETGVHKLNPEEKKALQKWINRHHYIKPGAKKVDGDYPTVSEVIGSGHYVKLSDGSLWQIHSSDTPITSSWITPAHIEVTQKSTGPFPYMLTNQLTGSAVRARPVSSVPEYLRQPKAPVQSVPSQKPKT